MLIEAEAVITMREHSNPAMYPDRKATLKQSARHYLRKDARINIRLSSAGLTMLKRRAAEEGLPYQTLAASVLHKYLTGHLKGTR